MIFITGDTHGDFSRLNSKAFPEQKRLTKDDYVIICGDFGLWDKGGQDAYWLKWLDEKPFTTLFVEGNHDNYDLLGNYPVVKWHGGDVQFIKPSVIHLMRGQVFELDGKRFFTMGGASSHDIEDGILEPDDPGFSAKLKLLRKKGARFRVNHKSWWKEELPSEREYRTAIETLKRNGNSVDYIISHCAPSSIAEQITGSKERCDALTDFFETVKNTCEFKAWFFGHYHRTEIVQSKFFMLYDAILKLNNTED